MADILLSFFPDPACKLKGMWIRRALKLPTASAGSIVEQRLHQAVVHAFTALQSLLQSRDDHATTLLSPRFVACVAIYLHLQDGHCRERMSVWQPLRVQEHSTRVRKSTTRLKSYVPSEQLGDDENSPLSQFPRCCQHLTAALDHQVHPIATPPVLCWLCGAGFLSWQALIRHTREAHGYYAEARKHLF